MAEELKPCPFCGSEAKSDNGFSPAESIVYAWCSNNECALHLIGDCGFTPETWNTRAPSPAGVDGWDVAGDILEKLSAAQAIIDGLRGEVESRVEAALAAERDAVQSNDGEVIELLAKLRQMVCATPQNDMDRSGVWISTNHPVIKRIDAMLGG